MYSTQARITIGFTVAWCTSKETPCIPRSTWVFVKKKKKFCWESWHLWFLVQTRNVFSIVASKRIKADGLGDSHCHVAIRTVVSKRSPLLLKCDEVPDSNNSVIRHGEVEELHAGEWAEGIQLARCPGEIICHEQATCTNKHAERMH